jgi:alcohol dehydrogenase class IV
MSWEFATSARILFGPGVRQELPDAVSSLGKRSLLTTGRHTADADVVRALRPAATFVVEGEPTLATIRAGVALFRRERCDVVAGIGGGSALDAAKAIAALAANSGEPLDYLEVIGRGRQLEAPAVPCIAVPTTAGTGSEVTRNAVLGSPEHGVKASLRHASMLPRLALVDPELTLTLPAAVTVSTGLDALTQIIEPYVSRRATPLTDPLCLEGIRRISRSFRRAASPAGAADIEARTDMALAALFGGLALANAGLGVVHGFAAPIGAMFPAPHAAVCAALLPHGMAANLRALRGQASDHPSIERYRQVAVALTGDSTASPDEGVRAVARLCAALTVPGLGAYGLTDRDVEEVCGKARHASSMKANPVELSDDELRAMLKAALRDAREGAPSL